MPRQGKEGKKPGRKFSVYVVFHFNGAVDTSAISSHAMRPSGRSLSAWNCLAVRPDNSHQKPQKLGNRMSWRAEVLRRTIQLVYESTVFRTKTWTM